MNELSINKDCRTCSEEGWCTVEDILTCSSNNYKKWNIDYQTLRLISQVLYNQLQKTNETLKNPTQFSYDIREQLEDNYKVLKSIDTLNLF
jgi:hypothetical protein